MTTSSTKKTAIAGSAIVLSAAFALATGAVAFAAPYPPNPGGNATSSASTVPAGGSVDFTFGTSTPFTPGTSVKISSVCTDSSGATFEGPSTVTTADDSGLANVTLTFTRPGECVVTATGAGNVPGGIVTATSTVTVTSSGGNYPNGSSNSSSDSLAKTGGNSSTVAIAVIGGGLLLAGVGAVIVARRREMNHN